MTILAAVMSNMGVSLKLTFKKPQNISFLSAHKSYLFHRVLSRLFTIRKLFLVVIR
ncbi:hypothetical protein DWUX_561 [Desulfovibrio diazotrophicus]|nr:hypothetical protein DWUX_561 [Desulfovibrio diazotrophicus]VVU42753.1 hypothetical protein DWUX_99 [Desulfovibrio diazotrophicus]